jgi:hypothetical protein
MKKALLSLLVLISISFAQAQNVKFKKGIVYSNTNECLRYSESANVVELKSIDGTQTVLLKFIRTGVGPNEGLYTKVIFVEQNKSFTSRSYIFTKKLLVSKMIFDGLLTDCIYDYTKLDVFIAKYDERIEETLIRY